MQHNDHAVKDPSFSLFRFNEIFDYNMNNATRQLGLVLLLLCVALHADYCSRRKDKENRKGKFVYSAVSNPQDCSKRFYTLLPWQTCSSKHHLNFSEKHPAICQLNREGCSYTYPSLVYSQIFVADARLLNYSYSYN